MRLLILGATGPCGLQLIQQALELNHTLVLYARSPDKLPESVKGSPAVTVVVGELKEEDAEKLSVALHGVHAVLSALGPSTKNGPFHPSNTPLAHAYAIVIRLMQQENLAYVVFAAMVGAVATLAHNAYKDVVAFGETIRAAPVGELVWTIARVPILTDKPERDVMAGYVGDGKTGTRLSRAAFAAFVLKELAENQWCEKAPLISSP